MVLYRQVGFTPTLSTDAPEDPDVYPHKQTVLDQRLGEQVDDNRSAATDDKVDESGTTDDYVE